MKQKNKAPVSPAETSRGNEKHAIDFLPFPSESVKYASPRILARIKDRVIDRVAADGWQWDRTTSLFVDEAEIWLEAAQAGEGRRATL